MASEKKDGMKVVVPKTAAERQRFKLEKLMKNPNKPVAIPEPRDPKLPRVFNPPEFIRNIWGSSAGAGSGDFHVYRGVRRREYARQKFLDEKAVLDEKEEAYRKRVEDNQKLAEERTAKKRSKRQKKKMKQKAAKKQKGSGNKSKANESESDDDDDSDEEKEEAKPDSAEEEKDSDSGERDDPISHRDKDSGEEQRKESSTGENDCSEACGQAEPT